MDSLEWSIANYNIADVLDNNSLLEKFVAYFWPNYLRQSEDDRRRLLTWLLSKSNDEGTRDERNLKVALEPALAFTSKCHNNPTYVDENGQTIMHILFSNYVLRIKDLPEESAVDRLISDCQITIDLLDAGASIIAADHRGNTPLGMAVAKNRLDIVEFISAHWNAFSNLHTFLQMFNARNSFGETILHILLKNYPTKEIDLQDYMKYTRIITYILNGGADFNIADINGITAVHYAAMKCYPWTLSIFNSRGTNWNAKTKIGDNLLILACKNITMIDDNERVSNTIDWFLNQGYNVNYRNQGGHTALHYAAQSSQVSIVKKLIEHGADVQVHGLHGTTPLHSAVMSSYLEESRGVITSSGVVDYLIECGVDVNHEEKEFGFSMIHMAALNRDESLFDRFVEKGFDVDKRSKSGLTALHLAAMSANTVIVKKLIKFGANVHYRDNSWLNTPLHLASMKGQFRSLHEMNILGLEEQLQMNQLSLIRHCFSRLTFKTDTDTDYKPVIDLLLNAGAEIDVKNTLGWTPLHCAVQHSGTDIVDLLLKARADVDALDNEFRLPLQNAVRSRVTNWEGIQCLLKYGANVSDIESHIKNIYDQLKIPKFTIADRLLRHVAKLECAHLPTENFNIPQHKRTRIKHFKPKYLQEIEKMKLRTLKNSVSLYDMLYMTSKQRASFVDKLPCDNEVTLCFPDYGVVIYGRCYEAVNRECMFESAKSACNLMSEVNWPELCIERIFSFLRNRDLRALIDSALKMEVLNFQTLSIN